MATQKEKHNEALGRLGGIGGASFTPIHRDEAEQIRLTGGGNASRYGGGSGVGSSGVDNTGRSENLAVAKPYNPTQAQSVGTGVTQDPYAAQANALYQQLLNRGPFRYDLQGDMLYRQYADQYSQLGQQAMRDTMGTAAGLTGGYGNSYAQMVGNQAYQGYLGQLNAMVPEFYDRAYQVWQDEGADLLNRYELARSRSASARASQTAQAEAEAALDTEETPATQEQTIEYSVPVISWGTGTTPVVSGQTAGFTTPTITPTFSLDAFTQWYDFLKNQGK